MAKKSGGSFFLEKGEKLILGAGILGMVVFLAWGVMSLTAADDPTEIVKKFKSHSQRVVSGVQGEGEDAKKLEDWIVRPAEFPKVPAAGFALVGPPFEPIHQPDMLRENPRVLGVFDAQLDVIRGPMRALDVLFQSGPTGDPEVLLGVLFQAQTSAKERDAVQQSVRQALMNIGYMQRQGGGRTPVRPGFPQPPRQPQPPQPQPQPMGTGGMPPAMAGAGDMYGSGVMAPTMNRQREDRTVRYYPPEEVGKQGLPLAETVYPLRAVMVQMAFPLKAQLEEIKRALRLQNLQQAASEAQIGGAASAMNTGMPMPVGSPPAAGPGGFAGAGGPAGSTGNSLYHSGGVQFDGFEVQRRVITASGQDLGWAPYNHYDEYFTKIRSRKIADQPDNPYLLPFLRYDQKLAAPLPQLADNLASYPSLRIPAILEAIRELQKQNIQVPTASEWEKRFRGSAGDQNPYAPFGQGALGAGVGTPVGGAGAMGAPMPAGNPPVGLPPAAGFPNPRPGMDGATGAGPAIALPEVENLLLRFLDPDVVPGYTYQYQVRMRMKNPNFGKVKDVREPNDAKVEFLEGAWVTLPETIHMPNESFLFAYDSGEYLKKAEATIDEAGKQFVMKQLLEYPEVQQGRRAVVQVQQWMPQVRATGDKIEPVGTWIVSEIPVAIGEYIGKRQLVRLPLWSAGAQNYVLRELTGGVRVDPKRLPDQYQPKGWPVNFRTKSLLVDFEGGQIREQQGSRELRDDSATELLILRPDGKLLLKNSDADMTNKDRETRDKTWDDWLTRVKQRKDAPMVNPNDPMNPFNRDGGATPPAAK